MRIDKVWIQKQKEKNTAKAFICSRCENKFDKDYVVDVRCDGESYVCLDCTKGILRSALFRDRK